MKYVNIAVNFLNQYSLIILPSLCLLLLIFAVVNWACNVYRKQDKKFAFCSRVIASYPDRASLYANLLPENYRRQWRAYVNSGAEKPSNVFEFVKLRQRTRLVWLFVLTAICSSLYVAVYIFAAQQIGYLVFQVAFWLAFGLVVVAHKAIKRANERRAKQRFGKLVSLLNNAVSTPKSNDTIIEETVKKLNSLNKAEVTDNVIGKASELLRSKGLDGNRSVEQQRRLNTALNGLLQAYARNAKKTTN